MLTNNEWEEVRLATLRNATAYEWSTLGWFKYIDLDRGTQGELPEEEGPAQHAAVYGNYWFYDQLNPQTQARIDDYIADEKGGTKW